MKHKAVHSTLSLFLLISGALLQHQTPWGIVLYLLAVVIIAASWIAPAPVDFEAEIAKLRSQGLYPSHGSGTDADVQNLVRANQKLLAIRLYREIHGVPLKQAVQAVKQLS